MAKRMPEKMLAELREARRAATLEDASFDWQDSHMQAECRSGNFEGRPDTFIKERVRNHHQMWIIQRIDRVIGWAEGKSV